MQKLNFFEKLAMLWVIPIAIAAVTFLTVTGAAIWLLRAVFVYTGTAGALGWVASQMVARYNASQWARLRKEDAQMRDLDRRFNQ